MSKEKIATLCIRAQSPPHIPPSSLMIRSNSVLSPCYSLLPAQSSSLGTHSFLDSITQSSLLSPHYFLLRIADITIAVLSEAQELLSFAKVMEHHAAYFPPSPSPLPPLGGEDKGEGANVKPVIVPLFKRTPIKIQVEGATKKFLVPQAHPDVRILVRWGDLSVESGEEKIFDSEGLWQLYSKNGSYLFRFTSSALGPVPYKVAHFNRDFTIGEVFVNPAYFNADQIIYPLEYPLDELLLTNLLALEKGVEIHACGVVDASGRGHLFVGQSEAGKTTMARLWQNVHGVKVLSDDRIILRKVKGKFLMYGTPWHGELELASPDRAPLTGVYFLSKGIKNELVPLRKCDATGRLFSCGFPPYYSQRGIQFTLTFLSELVQSIPCYELSFLPDQKVLKLVMSNED